MKTTSHLLYALMSAALGVLWTLAMVALAFTAHDEALMNPGGQAVLFGLAAFGAAAAAGCHFAHASLALEDDAEALAALAAERVDVFFEHGQWWAAVTRREQLADGPRCLVCGYCIEGSESHAVCMACQDWSAAFQCPYTGEGIQATYKPGDLLSDNALWLEMESDPSEAHPDTRGYLAEFAEKAGGVYFANCGTVRVVVEDGDEARALLLKHGDVTERDLA
jgi:hypothetical protein